MRIPRLWPLIALALIGCASIEAPPEVRQPNIVFIMADDLGYGELGSYGQTKIETPCLDRLALEGMRFTQFYSGSPVCAPSRCTLLTGLHTGHALIRDNKEMGGWKQGDPEGQMPLPAGTRTLATLLKARGYATCAIGKWGLGGPGSSGEPNAQGFDHWFGYLCQRQAHNHYPTHLWRNGERVELAGNTWKNLVGEHYAHDLMAAEALAFIDRNRERPFFLYLPFHIPHAALQAPEEEIARYRGRWPDPPYDGKQGYLPHPTPRAAYAAMVTRMDRDIGRIVDRIDELGLGENTLFVFTSDNGPTFNGGTDSAFFESTAGLRGLKCSVYEGGIRVPMIARWRGRIEAGSTSGHVAALWDVLPTLMDLAGAPTPPGLDGLSFAPTLLGTKDQSAHEYLYWEYRPGRGHQAARWGDWKAVRLKVMDGSSPIQLFDLATDPGEARDVADGNPEVVRRMEAILRQAHRPSNAFPFEHIDQGVPE